jgi:uncharacterized membrane protein
MLPATVPTSGFQKLMRVVLGALMFLAGLGHLSFKRAEFQAQVPAWVPLDADFVVLASGVVEIILGLAMIFGGRFCVWVGCLLAGFFVAVFPGNISQYVNGIDAFGLDTDQARLTRLFFQPALIAWALWSTGTVRAIISQYRSSRR